VGGHPGQRGFRDRILDDATVVPRAGAPGVPPTAMNKRRVRWDEHAGAQANAQRHLPPLVAEYFATVRDFLAKDPAPPKLHCLRLATKRLRYTLELFRPCYGPALDTRLAALRQVQQLLGEVNDCAAAWRLLSAAMNPSPQRTRVKHYLERQAQAKAQEFRRHWAEVFDAPGQEQGWVAYFARNARHQ